MSDQQNEHEIKGCEINPNAPEFVEQMKKLSDEAQKLWEQQPTTSLAKKLLEHGEPEKAEIMKGLMNSTWEAAFHTGIMALLTVAAKNAKPIKRSVVMPSAEIGQA